MTETAKGYWWVEHEAYSSTVYDENGNYVTNDEQYYPQAPSRDEMDLIVNAVNFYKGYRVPEDDIPG